MLQSLGWAALGTGFTFLMTALGAAMVFFFAGEPRPHFQKTLLGFAAGVMTAASVWSLLLPAIDRAAEGALPDWLPAAGGMLLGVVFLSALDALLPHLRRDRTWQDASWRQTTLLMTAITLHNVPEGMAVGLAFALVSGGEGFAGAAALAMGIGIQNFPEGAAVALPLRQGGWSRPRAFVGGMLSGAVEPVFGVLAALVNKQRTGLGEKVDVALVDSVASAMENITMIYQSTGRIPQRIGNRYESTYPYDVFPASDGDVVIAAGNAKLWKILCSVMGSPELADAPKFAGIQERIANHEELREIISSWTKNHTIDEIDKMLNDAGCPACPVNTIDRLVKDPQIAGDRGMFPEIDQPGMGKLQITAMAQKLTRTKSCPRKGAPLLGEDNAAIYGEMLDFDEAKLTELKEKGVI